MPKNPDSERAKAMRNGGQVYFILQGVNHWEYPHTREAYKNVAWDGESYVKVGYAKDVRSRLEGLQCGNPMKLNLLGYVKGGMRLERELHQWLKPYRHCRGSCKFGCNCEWFQYSHRVAQYINGLHLFKLGEGGCEPHHLPDEMLHGCECVWRIEDHLDSIPQEPTSRVLSIEELMKHNPKGSLTHLTIESHEH
tara:strand:+ start:205 stop:786 length:582 start_codon:yes stop_codon:yes gene_type:complete